ncbi:MAG TPA: hypothetical protein PL124_08785 [Candidatus Cloacimonadota bacterium]|nr:hypothetical protein [Candidatus Cloacimonadota bacterium]
MREFYRSRYDPKTFWKQYKQLILVAGMRSGKTALASIMGVYEFWDTITIQNPSEHYGLLKDQPIFISCVATSEKQALDGVFSNMVNMIENCEWLHTYFDLNIRSDRIECASQHVIMQVLSSWANTAVGRSNRCVIFDELANFEDTQGKRGAWEIWSRLRKSTDTFKDDGHVIGISSPRSQTDIIMELYDQAKREPNNNHTLALKEPTWNMNPNFTEAALRAEYRYDMTAFYRDYACEPSLASGVAFPEGVMLDKSIINILKTELKSTYIHALSIDPAARNDAFGIASGYMEPDAQLIIDGAHRFKREKGAAYIIPQEVRDFCENAIVRLNVDTFIFDTWMFLEMMDDFHSDYGVQLVRHTVNKKDYDVWRELQPHNMLKVVEDEILRMEVERLIIKGEGKTANVDHTPTNSKDTSDAVANLIWFYKGQYLELEAKDRPENKLNMFYTKAV